jgi:hypothetical protein
MTHEPIRVIHFSPHITWQGTQAELDAMLAEGWPMGSASEIIAACKRDAAEAEAYAAELEANALANRVAIMRLEAKLAKAVEFAEIVKRTGHGELEFLAWDMIAELKGDKP